jgi:hypothetical protein
MVSLSDYADGLVKVAMGRLFWPFDRAMKADCCAIILAEQGQTELLKELFGSSPQSEPAKEPELPPLTPASFRAMFRKKD